MIVMFTPSFSDTFRLQRPAHNTATISSPLPSNKIEGTPHHAVLLLRQALALQMSPNPATGSSIVIENRNLLGIPVEVPLTPVPHPPKT